MAVCLLPGAYSSRLLSRRNRNNVHRRTCMCDVRIPSSSLASVGFSEVSPSSNNSPVLGSKEWCCSSCCEAGVISFKRRLLSGRCSHGPDFKQSKNSHGAARLKASVTDDSSPDVSSPTSCNDAEVSHNKRLLSPRSGNQAEEMEIQEKGNEGKGTSNHEERGVSSTESCISTPEGVGISGEKDSHGNGFVDSAAIGTVVAGAGLVAVLSGFGAIGYFHKDQINEFLIQFSDFLKGYGPAGYGLFVAVYAILEMLAIPAIPLTMSAGLLFGAVVGTIVVSIASTVAATGAFLVARYFARDRLLALAKGNKRFLAIDKAIGDDGFRVVTLLRLSPLLPFSLGNYLYGLTSVNLGPYVLGSWLGMLPGSWAYVSAGAIGRAFIIKQESESVFSGGPEQWWTIGLGLVVTLFAATYVTRVAKEALKDIDEQ